MKQYSVIIEPQAGLDLEAIFDYIATHDTISKAKQFVRKLQKAIDSLSFMPQRCRDSLYIEDGKTKDLIFQGYTICYHIDSDQVHIVALFRQR
ncbi:MAG: type II toxin-antitoxin system RelE/ParE family toxin [Campylobacterales bacterium]|nr:type II toxin-antitoxin system RelE/ParE family toxin [Campylobacterales bacterium]